MSASVWVGGVCGCACTLEREGRKRKAGVYVSVGVHIGARGREREEGGSLRVSVCAPVRYDLFRLSFFF